MIFQRRPKQPSVRELIQQQLLFKCKKITSEIKLGEVIDYIGVKVTVVKYHQYTTSICPGIMVNWFDRNDCLHEKFISYDELIALKILEETL